MKSLVLAASILAVSATPALAQRSDATAVGVGISSSRANSASQSTAIGGGNATGGNAVARGGQGGQGGGGLGVGTGGNVVINSSVPAQETINNTGTSTVKNVPSVFAPGLSAAGLETCLGSVSGGGAFVGTGFSFGTTIPDPGCAARLDARTLWSFGLRKMALARLCLNGDIYKSDPGLCAQYLPAAAPAVVPIVPVAAPIPADYYYSDLSAYRGGPIMLSEGSTGHERLCNDYDTAKRRCRVWFGAVASKPKPVLRSVKGFEHHSAVSPTVEEAKKGDRLTVASASKTVTAPPWIQLIHPEQPAQVVPEKKEVSYDESTSRCLGFCAVAGGLKR